MNLAGFDHAPEAREKILAVVRPGAGFGVVLHAEDGPGLVPESFKRLVVQVEMRLLQERKIGDVYAKTVVL